MSAPTERRAVPAPDGRVRTVASVGGLLLAGIVAGIVGTVVLQLIANVAGIAGTPVEAVLGGGSQIGFGALAIGYLLYRDDYRRFVRVSRPTAEDIAWVVALPICFVVIGVVLETVLDPVLTAAFGSFDGHGTDGKSTSSLLLSTPLLIPYAFVTLYLLFAPAEELLFRGIVQGRLRESFDTAGVVLCGGVVFGLLHTAFGLLTPSIGAAAMLYWGIETTVVGWLWGYVYERTENLLVTSVTHAMSWTLPVHAIAVALGI